VVRRNKPRAVPPLAASFGIGIASTVLSVVAYPLIGVVTSRSGGMDSYMLVQSAVTVGFSLVHAVSGVLLVLGLGEPGDARDWSRRLTALGVPR
jgi:ABC-type Fe3+ transport system permease subunit